MRENAEVIRRGDADAGVAVINAKGGMKWNCGFQIADCGLKIA
ncbi:MAG: hypothetical protein WCH40_13290 [Verrucomicrobiales bacterium]